ncbi:hypothetical protein FGO68_gene82 [Halteria grandinella]|uniref:Uncharacterized protein n=1 Tax=Halteria grandinella TaxID=5974 RepID=A0A8J8NKM4_HALGN|nr:hypothetical protein FGO68_gene82 [Halteria grandinella]
MTDSLSKEAFSDDEGLTNKYHSIQEILALNTILIAEYTRVIVQKLDRNMNGQAGIKDGEYHSIEYLQHNTAKRTHIKLGFMVDPDQARYIEMLEYDSPNGLFKPIEIIQ